MGLKKILTRGKELATVFIAKHREAELIMVGLAIALIIMPPAAGIFA
ncbi:hypothetical protein KAR26_00215 [Candidatus Parcubacteria bacterium]|nr:hypothetical protein [Candidatus Parcubacteria bacterium]